MTQPFDERFLREHELATALHRAGELVRNELDTSLSAYSVNFLLLSVLLAVACGRAQSPAAIARLLQVDPAVITRSLGKLEARRFLQRDRSLEDRRSVLVSLTESGRAILTELCNVASETLHTRLGAIPHDEFEHLQKLLAFVTG